ncbi:MAG: fused MFS/spermidine synthase, partial [Solobacterium sp.]|nr:fused MFS/spermidine synthase [Solobacterium sp.]
MNEEIKPEISIAEGVEDGHPVRYYLQDDVAHSATYLEPELRNELIFPYMKKWNLMFELDMEIRDVLMIGGAGYSYPKYIISHKPAVAMTVAELDETAVQRARDWFFLDELMTKYQTEETGRLQLVTADGRQLLENEEKQYDVIINDAYSGFMPAFPLATAECAQL